MSSFAFTSMSLPLSECVPVSSKVREGTDCPPSLSICSSQARSTLNHRLEFSSPGWKPACPSDPPVSPTPWSYVHCPPHTHTSQLVTRSLDPSFRPQIVQQALLSTELSLWGHNFLFELLGLPLGFLKFGTFKGENLSSVIRKHKASPVGRDGSAGKVLVVQAGKSKILSTHGKARKT